MNGPERIMVVAATARELATPSGWRAVRCGVGPVDAAATTAAALAEWRPAAVLHVGIAGARRGSGVEPPALVIGDAALYCDLDVPPQWAPKEIPPSPLLLDAARRVVPSAVLRCIGTSARVGGSITERSRCDVEAMEGFAVLRAAALAGIPALEVRAIANHIEEDDRALWRFEDAFEAITAVTPLLVAEFALCVP